MPYTEVAGHYRETETRVTPDDEKNLVLSRTSFYNSGQDSYTQAPAQDPDSFSVFQNVLPVQDGTVHIRWGTTTFANPSQIAIGGHQYEFQNLAGSTVRFVTVGQTLVAGARTAYNIRSFDGGGTQKNAAVFVPDIANVTKHPTMALSRGYGYWADGATADRIKWTGNDTATNGLSTWGLTAPTTGLVASASGSGSLTIQSYRDYCFAYKTSDGHISDISSFTRLAACTSKAQVDLSSIDAVVATESGYNTDASDRVILATRDGGPRNELYLVGLVGDTTTTTYTDTLTEDNLINQPLYSQVDSTGQEVGVLNNGRPPADGVFPIRHRGRMYMMSGRNLRFSKSIAEVSTATSFEIGGKFEEAWPVEFSFPVTLDIDPPVGMFSDGTYLYIFTTRHTYRIVGDGPANFDPPQILFQNIGLYRQETFTFVYRSGTPVGAIWLTPDRRVLASDFNTYQDIGLPIKNILTSIPDSTVLASTFPWYDPSMTFADYDQYHLCLFSFIIYSGGIGTTYFFAYDLDHNAWVDWSDAGGGSYAGMSPFFWINPTTGIAQIIFADSTQVGRYLVFDKTLSTSASGLAYGGTLTTAWLDFGEPTMRKILNGLQVSTKKATGTVAAFQVTVQGANTDADLLSPTTIVSTTLSAGSSGFPEKCVPLAGRKTGYKYYRLTFLFGSESTDTSSAVMLRDYTLRAVPLYLE